MLASYDEVDTSLDTVSLVRARIWGRKGARLPSLIAVELGGWVVKIEVFKDETGCKPSFAEVVAGTSGSLGRLLEADHSTEGPSEPPLPTEELYRHGGSSGPSWRRRRRRRKPRKKIAHREGRQTTPEGPSEEEEPRGTRGEGTLHDNQGIVISVPGTLAAPRVVRTPGEGRLVHRYRYGRCRVASSVSTAV
ncbi:hypothetical protein QJS10_CPA03g01511 [Acorus calamus]|uniref:Uncharacterized protein n=1 Tax=Acorus calamus TaxID=4465 RepID=A0AAV9FBQ9_ACOCL|nr:hypothetical protein QJS10_CPA03g01511 [Acorus calamus]